MSATVKVMPCGFQLEGVALRERLAHYRKCYHHECTARVIAWNDLVVAAQSVAVVREMSAFPHEGACKTCRAEKRCNACGKLAPLPLIPLCTNGRCDSCHTFTCTSGGSTGPGHGFGKSGGPHYTLEQAAP